MDNQGFITMHRKLLDNPIITDEGLLSLFVVLLLMAGYEEKRVIWNGQEITLKRGQFITGRFSLAEKLHVKPTTVYYRLNTLKKLGIIDIKSNNKFSVITIVKYSQYQDKVERANNKTDNKLTTNRQQTDTTNNINNKNNITAEATPTAEESFNQKEYIKSLLDSKQKHLNIIGLYFEQKQLTLPNKIAIQAEVRRNVRPATSLVGWDSKAIINTMAWLESQKLTWGLEAVVKNIARVNS